jgi:hypothetical protein
MNGGLIRMRKCSGRVPYQLLLQGWKDRFLVNERVCTQVPLSVLAETGRKRRVPSRVRLGE